MQAFPTHPDQLSNEWLSDVLGYPISAFEVQFFSEGTGVMAWVMRLQLSSPAGSPDSVIAKFPSCAEANRETAKAYNMYGREIQFYDQVAAHISLRTPECFYSAFDPESSDFVILMEDLIDMRIGDQVEGCTLAEAKAVIESVALFHASAWEPKQFSDLESHHSPMQIAGMQAMYPVGWPVVLKQFGEFIPEAVRPAAENFPSAIPGLLEKMCEAPVCLTHADVRLDNIFFGKDEIALVDWQSLCTSAPEQDLAYFITQSVPTDVRAQEDLVAYYHSVLTDAGIDYSLERCRERYVISALYLLCYAVVIAGTLDLGNDRGQELGRTIVKNAFDSLIELDAFALLN